MTKPLNRFQAFAIHFGISLLIFVVLAYLVVYQWYPDIFFETDGGWRGMQIIIGVDLVLGPLLTLIVYKAGKPGLKFDLSAIAALQTVCLIAGTWIVWSERPLAVVYVDSRFEVMTADDYAHLDEVPSFRAYPGKSPKWVMVRFPDSLDQASAAKKEAMKQRVSPATLFQFYVPFDPSDPTFVAERRDVEVIRAHDKGANGLDRWLAEHGGELDDYGFYTFSTRYVYRYLGYRNSDHERIGFLDVQPR